MSLGSSQLPFTHSKFRVLKKLTEIGTRPNKLSQRSNLRLPNEKIILEHRQVGVSGAWEDVLVHIVEFRDDRLRIVTVRSCIKPKILAHWIPSSHSAVLSISRRQYHWSSDIDQTASPAKSTKPDKLADGEFYELVAAPPLPFPEKAAQRVIPYLSWWADAVKRKKKAVKICIFRFTEGRV